MEDKPLTESINKQYSKYGSLRMKERESKIELCNAEDPMKFLTRIDSSIKDAKARVKKSIDNSSISEDYESSFDQLQTTSDKNQYYLGNNNIPLVKLDRTKATTPTDNSDHLTIDIKTATSDTTSDRLPNTSTASASQLNDRDHVGGANHLPASSRSHNNVNSSESQTPNQRHHNSTESPG